jgi:hypothetical protein
MIKEISLLANIVVYLCLFFALFYNVTDNIKRSKFEHLMLSISMLWMLFISCYLIIDFKNMVISELNLKLNIYETITNFIFFLYLFYKLKAEHCKGSSLFNKDIGGGGIKNPPKNKTDIGGGGIKNPSK